jgi:Ca-activated chloride channel homolog
MRYLLPIFALGCLLLDMRAGMADELRTDTNIVTGLDISDSIDAHETRLEIEGMARAIRSPEFQAAIQQGRHGRVGFAVFLWADDSLPVFVSWKLISSAQEAQAVADEMTSRVQAILDAGASNLGALTNVSQAMEYATEMLRSAPYPADRAIVNIVSDGEDNVGEGPQWARDRLVGMGATINGVVLGNDPMLMEYYRREVIGGPTAFVLAADSRERLVDVLAQKFITEIVLNVEKTNQDHR